MVKIYSRDMNLMAGMIAMTSVGMGRERMQAAYAHAIAGGYHFYSYGDSSLLLPHGL
jgi:S-adenosylmethionine:tRNA ribosyltransferase-isomerase